MSIRTTPHSTSTPYAALALAFALGLGLAACSPGDYGGGGGSGGQAAGSTGGSGSAGDQSASNGADSVQSFEQTVFPILTANCNTCHAGAGPGFPHIASADSQVAHDASVDNQKVNFANPSASRLVQRLVADFHYCWSGDCMADGLEMSDAITQWALLIDYGGGGTDAGGAIQSASLSMADGVEDTAAERIRGGLIALWEFKEGAGEVAADTSGVDPAIDLDLQGEVAWIPSFGLDFNGAGRAIGSSTRSRKLFDRLAAPETGSQEYTVEGWVTPANTDQDGPARIISYSAGTGNRNFTLGQILYYYNFRNRSLAEGIDNNGTPALQTADADEDLQATRQHVVATFDPLRGRRLYVNGTFTDDLDESGGGPLWNWDDRFRVVLGNETSNNRPWQGQIQLVAVYDRVLSDAEILQNFHAGVGQRFLLDFDLSQWIPGGSIRFEVTEFDAYSYLFCAPQITSTSQGSFRVADLSIAVNGQIPVSGQAFTNVDALVTQSTQQISELCSLVPIDQGSGLDQFTIDFEVLGDFQNVVAENNPPAPPVLDDPELRPDAGMRNFERVNATFAALTGVDATTPQVETTFLDLHQQLPATEDMRSFLSSHQVAIANLSLEYCDALVEAPALRSAFFGPGFDFDAAATDFANPLVRDALFTPLAAKLLGTGLANQPVLGEVAASGDSLDQAMNDLVDQLVAACPAQSCDAVRTRTIAKALCGALLGSAAVSIH